jgi:hypothetical protein
MNKLKELKEKLELVTGCKAMNICENSFRIAVSKGGRASEGKLFQVLVTLDTISIEDLSLEGKTNRLVMQYDKDWRLMQKDFVDFVVRRVYHDEDRDHVYTGIVKIEKYGKPVGWLIMKNGVYWHLKRKSEFYTECAKNFKAATGKEFIHVLGNRVDQSIKLKDEENFAEVKEKTKVEIYRFDECPLRQDIAEIRNY